MNFIPPLRLSKSIQNRGICPHQGSPFSKGGQKKLINAKTVFLRKTREP